MKKYIVEKPEMIQYHKDYQKRVEVKERRKQYRDKPEIKILKKEYQKEYLKRPEVKLHKKECFQDLEVIKHKKEYLKEYRQRPEYKEKYKLYKQGQWQSMTKEERDEWRQKLKDSDGDRVPDEFDCNPDNVMEQDSPQMNIYQKWLKRAGEFKKQIEQLGFNVARIDFSDPYVDINSKEFIKIFYDNVNEDYFVYNIYIKIPENSNLGKNMKKYGLDVKDYWGVFIIESDGEVERIYFYIMPIEHYVKPYQGTFYNIGKNKLIDLNDLNASDMNIQKVWLE